MSLPSRPSVGFWDLDYVQIRQEDFHRLRKQLEVDLPERAEREITTLKEKHSRLRYHTESSLRYKNELLVAELGTCEDENCSLYRGHEDGHLLL